MAYVVATLALALVALGGAFGFYHWRARKATLRIAAAHERVRADTARERVQAEATTRKQAAEKRLQDLVQPDPDADLVDVLRKLNRDARTKARTTKPGDL